MAPQTATAYAETAGDIFQRVSDYVERHPGCDAGEVRLAVPAIRGATDAALRRLVRAGILQCRSGRYWSFKPYRPSE